MDRDVFDSLDCENAYNLLLQGINNAKNMYSTIKQVTKVSSNRNKVSTEWFSKELKLLRTKKLTSYRNQLGKPKLSLEYAAYHTCKKIFVKRCKVVKRKFYKDKFEAIANDSKALWKSLNKVLGKVNDKTTIPQTFNVSGIEVSDPCRIANSFTEHYVSVGKKTIRCPSKIKQEISRFFR
jgi:hypothetical protein